MKFIVLGIVGALGFVLAGYYFIQSDYALLGDKVCLEIASTDVLGNLLYGQSCPRIFYKKDVEILHSDDRTGAAFFKFYPVAGKETECPPISVIIDRKTGEGVIEK